MSSRVRFVSLVAMAALLSVCLRIEIAPGQDVVLLGDVNQDGFVNLLDIDLFLQIIVSGNYQAESDINWDGTVDLLDVAPIVQLLAGIPLSKVEPESISNVEFVPTENEDDHFQFTIEFDNHEPNSITAFDARYISVNVRIRNTTTNQEIEDRVLVWGIDVAELGNTEQETVGLVNARMELDWMFFNVDDFGPEGDWIVEYARIELLVPSFKDTLGHNITGTVEQKGF